MEKGKSSFDADTYERWRTIRLAIIFAFVIAVIAVSLVLSYNSSFYYTGSMMFPYMISSGGVYIWNIVGVLFSILFIIWVISWFLHPYSWYSYSFRNYRAERILKERYARGEISYKAYKDMLDKIRK